MFNKNNDSAKKIWQLINNKITLKKDSEHNNSQHSGPNYRSKCEEFNAFFSNIAK